MTIKSENKEKSLFYLSMRDITDYDSRWSDRNVESYVRFDLKKADNYEYSKKRNIYKFNVVEIEEEVKLIVGERWKNVG